MTPRRTRALGAALALGLCLGACSPAEDVLGLRPNTGAPAARPVLRPEQAVAVAERALVRADLADTLRTSQAAREAYTGLALRLAAPTYAVQRALGAGQAGSGAALRPQRAPSRVVVTSGQGWPRSLLAVDPADRGTPPRLSVLRSPDVRTPYRVAARVDLLPGAALPATVPADRGADLLPADVPGLVATPRRAIADYARLLQTGRSGETSFAPDAVSGSVRDRAREQAAGVAAVAGFSQEHRPQPSPVVALRTADGGALVVGAVDRVDRFRVRPGAGTITPRQAYTAIGGLPTIRQRADVTTVQVLALVLPPAGRGPARVVGFTEQPVAVSAT